MTEVWTMGELLVEVMRPRRGMKLSETGEFLGPYPSGATAIFIDTVARLGHSAAIISGVGDDDFGRCLLDRFSRDGVNADRVLVVPNKATGVAFVTYFEDGSRRFLYHWDNTPAVMARTPDPGSIDNPKFFHVMGCALMPNEEFRASVFDTAKMFAAKGAKVTFDPNIRFELLGGRSAREILRPILDECAILFPGERELQLLTGEEDVERAVKKALRGPKMESVVLKRGSRGATVYSGGDRIEVPAYTVKEVDPTGAGDCFDAGFVCGLLEGRSLTEAAEMASAAGALNAAAFGPMEGDISAETVRAVRERRSPSR
jgi:sugar/nucleoside kinase (ribokinase family)